MVWFDKPTMERILFILTPFRASALPLQLELSR